MQDQKADDIVYEELPKDPSKIVIHSENCIDLIKCRCTPLSVSAKLEEKRRRWWIDNHKAIKERERLRRKQGCNGQPQRDHFDPTMPKEDEV
jgi:hypothetical protein